MQQHQAQHTGFCYIQTLVGWGGGVGVKNDFLLSSWTFWIIFLLPSKDKLLRLKHQRKDKVPAKPTGSCQRLRLSKSFGLQQLLKPSVKGRADKKKMNHLLSHSSRCSDFTSYQNHKKKYIRSLPTDREGKALTCGFPFTAK